MGLLLASSVYWTWRLREKLTDAAPRAPQETLRLWFAWALLGIAPPVVFFLTMYHSTFVMPSRFVERLNRSLAHFHVAYSAEVGSRLYTSSINVRTLGLTCIVFVMPTTSDGTPFTNVEVGA